MAVGGATVVQRMQPHPHLPFGSAEQEILDFAPPLKNPPLL